MKNTIIIFFIFSTLTIVAQNNFPESDAIWNVNYVDPGGITSHEMLYGLYGDTIINDTLYHKLYSLSDTILSAATIEDFIGGIRSEGPKVWLKPENKPDPWIYPNILLYDFSAEVGDTIWHKGFTQIPNCDENCFAPDNHTYSVVTEITYQNGYKIQSTRGTGPPSKWYEGIGSIFGILGSIQAYTLVGESYNLACFKYNNSVKYKNNLLCEKCFCTDFTTETREKKNMQDVVSILPNLAQNSISVTINRPYRNSKIEILDINGRIIYSNDFLQQTIHFPDIIRETFVLVKLTLDEQVIIKKVIMN